jgi:hypothetical protein
MNRRSYFLPRAMYLRTSLLLTPIRCSRAAQYHPLPFCWAHLYSWVQLLTSFGLRGLRLPSLPTNGFIGVTPLGLANSVGEADDDAVAVDFLLSSLQPSTATITAIANTRPATTNMPFFFAHLRRGEPCDCVATLTTSLVDFRASARFGDCHQ